MGYCIVYDGGDLRWETEKLRWSRVVVYSGMFMLLFCLLTEIFWPDGAQVLEQWLYPGDAAVTKNALQTMSLQIRAGENVKDVLTTFCREIINAAQTPG